MIDAAVLLADLTRMLKGLEDDLRTRIADFPNLRADLQQEWQAARNADRTAETFESWSDQVIAQAGVHWLLSCVFLRFIEDNQLVDRPWFAGPSSARQSLARDRHESYFRAHPIESDRDYFITCFREAGRLPGLVSFFDEAHNPVFRLGISGDAAMRLLQFWQQIDPNTGLLKHDFTDPEWNTRFLGDLYQDLSEATRKRYALLQTPEFVEEFILDRTLTPAVNEFGYKEVRMIDPTCGSGHFLLGGFQRLLDLWARNEPGRNRRDVAQRALDAVAGVDLNPFAVAIARFRLLVAALKASEVHRLTEAPDFKIHVAIGDSLLHGLRFGLTVTDDMFEDAENYADTGLAHVYASEDLKQVQSILGRQYHAVVGNPPYIVVKDAALNAAYRKHYSSCHMKYSLGAPFTERFFELATSGKDGKSAGYVGLITANSFMKREFGSKLIEQVLPRLDLTHVVDTSGAYIPGHGTPTVIMFGRHRMPVGATIRTVMGIKGEPSTPENPANGQVWSAILKQIDQVGSESEFASVADAERAVFAKHPWSIGGGGASELKELLEAASVESLGARAVAMGFFGISAADDVMLADSGSFLRRRVEVDRMRQLVSGDEVRDWISTSNLYALFPYDSQSLQPISASPGAHRWLWPSRTFLGSRVTFGKKTYIEEGRPWWEWHQIILDRIATPLTITFSEVATHNHFVLDRGGKVFKQTAPVIKLPADASEDEHLGLLGLLNSSVAAFWFRQVAHCKGNGGINGGIAAEQWEKFFAYNSSVVAEYPLTDNRPVEVATLLDIHARALSTLYPAALLTAADSGTELLPTRESLNTARATVERLRRLMNACQDELDWHCYRIYYLLPAGATDTEFEYHASVEVALGERAFEIVLARRMAAGIERTTWFERHNSIPITEIPNHWPLDYQLVVQRRIALIESDRNIGLIERPECKRRWNSTPWDELEKTALRNWLLAKLESPHYWSSSSDQFPQLTSTSRLADATRRDADFMQIATLYAGHADFDPGQLVAELIAGEVVPFLPILRYAESGLRKRSQWEDTWTLQRLEDAIDAEVEAKREPQKQELLNQLVENAKNREPDATMHSWVEETLTRELTEEKKNLKFERVGKIPVPPKYQSKDFLKSDFWRLRGGLDVPKERWISYPGCERGADGSLVIAWAGWDHLQQATALAAYYLDMKDNEGWQAEQLQPLLAGLLELIPWLKQWHNEYNADAGVRMGDYFEGFVTDETKSSGFTLDDLRTWKPKATTARRSRKKATT